MVQKMAITSPSRLLKINLYEKEKELYAIIWIFIYLFFFF